MIWLLHSTLIFYMQQHSFSLPIVWKFYYPHCLVIYVKAALSGNNAFPQPIIKTLPSFLTNHLSLLRLNNTVYEKRENLKTLFIFPGTICQEYSIITSGHLPNACASPSSLPDSKQTEGRNGVYIPFQILSEECKIWLYCF